MRGGKRKSIKGRSKLIERRREEADVEVKIFFKAIFFTIFYSV